MAPLFLSPREKHTPRHTSIQCAYSFPLTALTTTPIRLLILLLSLSHTSMAADPCASLYKALSVGPTVQGISFTRPGSVLPCTQSVRFESQRDLSNLDSIVKYLAHFYSPLHIAKRAPDPRLPSNYDVIAQLRKVRRTSWKVAEDFYSALGDALGRLNDGHTGILTNCPPFQHVLAFPLVAVVEAGRPVVRVAPVALYSDVITAAAARAPFSFNAAAYAGAKIVTVNGKPAWQALQWYAWVKAGNYHDPGQRVNSLFASASNGLGYFAYRRKNPRSNFLPLTLIRRGSTKVETVRVPWLSATSSSNLPGFTSTQDYYSGFCAPSSASSSNLASNSNSHSNFKASWQLLRPPQRASLNISPVQKGVTNQAYTVRRATFMRRIPRGPNHLRPLRNLRNVLKRSAMGHATQLSADRDLFPVSVIQLNTFDSGSSASDPLYPYLVQAIRAFNLVNKHASRVIIDLSGNPGGYTELGPWIITLLLGSDRFPQPRRSMQADLKHFLADTPFSRDMLSTGSYWYDWRVYADTLEKPYTTRNRMLFFNPVSVRKFGSKGASGLYSSCFKEQMQSLQEYMGRRITPILGNKKFMLFSDGLCFSTCGTFANTIMRRFNVPAVTIGGIPGRKLSFSGGGGGFVLTDVENDMLATIPRSMWSRPGCPRNFTTRMSMSMRFVSGLYNERAYGPIEFVFLPGKHSISYTLANLADPSLQYLQAARFFN